MNHPKRSPIRHAESAPPVVQAAQIALVAMGIAKVATWAAFIADESNAHKIVLTPDQQSVLERYRVVLPHISRRGDGQPGRTIVGCTSCDMFMVVDSSTPVPTRCALTLHCEGKPVKAKSTQERAEKPEAVAA